MSNSLPWAVISCQNVLHFDTQNFKVSTYFRKKMSNIKFHKNPSTGSRAVPYGQTHNEANSRLSQFWERADERSLKELLFLVAQRGFCLPAPHINAGNRSRSFTIQQLDLREKTLTAACLKLFCRKPGTSYNRINSTD